MNTTAIIIGIIAIATGLYFWMRKSESGSSSGDLGGDDRGSGRNPENR